MNDLVVIKSISEAHSALNLKRPKHPLISVSRQDEIDYTAIKVGLRVRVDLYQIWIKDGVDCQFGYGRNTYDFHDGTLAFMKPGQVMVNTGHEAIPQGEGYAILFHPDLIRKSELGKNIDQYNFFDYEVNEALHISDSERSVLVEIIHKIENEINQNIDKHSQSLIISNLELFLGYCTRYYDRQFYTRVNFNKDLVSKFESFIKNYYSSLSESGAKIPSVALCAENLNMSPSYLSDLLKKETGKNTQEHIHDFIVEKAKNRLLGSADSLSEIAYSLGFEYPQHFTKVFKKKTGMTPSEYRQLN